MDEKLKQLETLLSMFDGRDQMWAKHNRQIGNIIAPTVFEALYELFDLDRDSVEWVDLQIMENVMLVICNVTYDPATTQSHFLHRVDEADRPGTPIQVQRFLRIGVPLTLVFSAVQDIKEFLLHVPVMTAGEEDDDVNDVNDSEFESPEDDTAHSQSPLGPLPIRRGSELVGFDVSELSEYQVTQLMLYRYTVATTNQ